MTINNPKNWNIIDPCPNKELDNIKSFADRAVALYARNKINITNGHLQIIGAIFMLKGLEYHYENFLNINSKIPKITSEQFTKENLNNFLINREKSLILSQNLAHEACAYLNRLGQFRKFYGSKFAQNNSPKSLIGEILNTFRDNYSAHRKIDNEKYKEQDLNVEILFSCGSLWDKNGNRMFQGKNTKGKIINFNLIRDHQNIMKETYNIIGDVINKNNL